MAWAKIEIEQTINGWRAEMEVGGLNVRRAMLYAQTFDDIFDQVVDKYREFVPQEEVKPPPVVLPPLEPVNMPSRFRPKRGNQRQRRGQHGEMVT